MKTLCNLLAAVCLCLTGCGSVTVIHETPGGVALGVYGTPDISDAGFTAHLDFNISATDYRETIQRITYPLERGDWQGVESHLHYGAQRRMFWPDVQAYRRTDPSDRNWHHRRVNTVNPGRTEGAPWYVWHGKFPFFTLSATFKGVVMLDGWLDADGKPVGNKLYFAAGGLQGGRVAEERPDLGLTYQEDAWGAEHPDNPNPGRATYRLSVGDTMREWVE